MYALACVCASGRKFDHLCATRVCVCERARVRRVCVRACTRACDARAHMRAHTCMRVCAARVRSLLDPACAHTAQA